MMFLPFSPPSPSPSLPLLLLLLSLPPSLLSPALSHSPLSWTSPHDPCYHLDGRPRHCLSEFINAAYGVPVGAALGPSERRRANVTALTDLHNPHNLTCWAAPGGSGDPEGGDWVLTLPLGRRFEITYISLQFCHQGEPTDPISISVLKSMDQGRSWRPMQHYSSDCPGRFGLPARTVAQTRHQETEPLCSDPRPLQRHRGGMVLAFSTLDGRPSSPDFDYSPTLQDWVTATDIRVVLHQAERKQQQGAGGRAEEGVAGGGGGGVLRWRAGSRGENVDKANALAAEKAARARKAENRGSSGGENKADKSRRRGHGKGAGHGEEGHNVTRKEGGDTAMAASSKKGSGRGKGRGRKREGHLSRPPCQDGSCDWTVVAAAAAQGRGNSGQELRRRRNNQPDLRRQKARKLRPAPAALVSAPPVRPPPLLALSDLQVGGRCKCNGHASRCRRDDAGRALCVCEHHTAGADCDVCEDFYYDRPWQRATPAQPHPCVSCECNSHSSKCRFSMEVFQQSGRRSGGVCLKCRHHTAGRHCQYCQHGYTRDHSKGLSHRKACQPCQCHPMGAVGRGCNQTTGQCLCRDGVTGPRCNRCAAGFKQGHSPLRPCIRIQEVVPTTPMYQPQYSIAEECVSYCQPSQVKVKMNLETYCLKDYVLKVQVRGMERSGPWWQFSVSVQTVFRTGSPSRVRRGPQALWVPDRDLGCGCPALHVGRTYLLIGAEEGGRGWGPEERRLVADRVTLALQWREDWNAKLRGFRGQDKRGRCPPKTPDHQRGPAKPQSGYIPPHLVPEQETVAVHAARTHQTHPEGAGHTEDAENSLAAAAKDGRTSHARTRSSSSSRRREEQQPPPSPSAPPALVCSTPSPV